VQVQKGCGIEIPHIGLDRSFRITFLYAQSICPLNNFNSFHCIIIKLCENVCWQNISAKFNNQPDPMKHFGVLALELAKFAKINLVRSVQIKLVL